MSNDLIIPSELENAFPTMSEGLKKAARLFQEVESFEDVERLFLKGQGLSPNTYRTYLTAVKQFYEYTNGLNPLQVRPGDIEAFYDHIVKKVGKDTANLRVRGLKKFFAGIRNVVPFYTSPFEIMGEKLKRKLNRTNKSNQTKKALTDSEVKAFLSYLAEGDSHRARADYAIVFMLVTSGLRASELTSLRWGDIDEVEGTYTAYFTGKGDRPSSQELYAPAVKVALNYFVKQFRREPKADDHLFYTIPSYKGDTPHPMQYHTVWERVKAAGDKAKKAGVITRNVNFSPHLMRRSYGTALYKKGMGVKAVQQLLRDKSLEVVMNHYIDDTESPKEYLEQMYGEFNKEPVKEDKNAINL